MSVLLDFKKFISAVPTMVDWGGTLTPGLGGEEQQINRLGTRFSIAYTVDFETDEEARIFCQDLRVAKQEGAIARFPQIGITVGAPGSPLVDGAVEAGTAVAIKGLAPNYTIKKGQFASFIVGGRRYLYSFRAQATADASGNVEATVHPTLRVSLTDEAVVELAKPMIEGRLLGDEVQWEHAVHSHEPFVFSIREMG